MRKSKYINNVINGLRVIDNYSIKSERGNHISMFKVKCIHCNKEFNSFASSVLCNKRVCECQKKFISHNANGDSTTRLYEVYKRMIERVNNKNNKQYKYYGGRGIKICDEWLHDFQVFKKWAYDNGYDDNAPKGKYTIDRIDVNGDYEPNNCRWITIQEQQYNKRNNHYLIYNNKKQTMKEWSDELGIKFKTLEKRIRMGWSDEKAITTPVNISYRRERKVS